MFIVFDLLYLRINKHSFCIKTNKPSHKKVILHLFIKSIHQWTSHEFKCFIKFSSENQDKEEYLMNDMGACGLYDSGSCCAED